MKIAILTQPLHSNYGGILQAYAMQHVLRRMGHDPVTVDYRDVWFKKLRSEAGEHIPLNIRTKRILSTAKRLFLHHVLNKKTKLLYSIWGQDIRPKIFANLWHFISTNLSISPTINDSTKLRKWAETESPDLWIVGSDQVWREKYSPNILDFFLNFLPESDTTPAISYAASFGVAENYISAEKFSRCRQLLQNQFRHVTVREREAVDIVRRDFGRQDVRQVLDPTLLLTSEDYRTLIDRADMPKQPIITSYILDPTPDKETLVNAALQHFGIGNENLRILYGEEFDSRRTTERMPSVSYWLASIAGANFVVTDSFHGMVFSILFNRPFVVIPNASRGLERFTSLLSPLGLTDRIVRDPLHHDCFTPIQTDYLKTLSSLRNESIDMLTEIIDCK